MYQHYRCVTNYWCFNFCCKDTNTYFKLSTKSIFCRNTYEIPLKNNTYELRVIFTNNLVQNLER